MALVIDDDGTPYPITVDIVIVGGGAAGLVTALAASDRGLGVLIIERDAVPRGSTSLSAGLIPAPGTRYQRAVGIRDSVDVFAADILRKAHGEPHPDQVNLLASTIGPAIEWLGEKHGLPFSVIDNFSYPGHSAMRMHGLPTRSGEELMDRLRAAAESAGIDILTSSVVDTIARRGGLVTGVVVSRGDGARERIGCGSLVLACNGFGGNPDLVRRYIPEIAGALYFGHPGNQGDAVLWGDQLGAATRHLSGYQGHGSVAQPHGILITWATITEGGFQVNAAGRRFANEARGYSEAAAAVIAEPGALAWTIFDERIAEIAVQFEDFRSARSHHAIVTAATIDELAEKTRLPLDAVRESFASVSEAKMQGATDIFGRNWDEVPQLAPPFSAVRVTGALFHTQGGLSVDANARVLGKDSGPFPNLYAVGGAACGVSGSDASGYLSGNGLLTAVGYGYIAGRSVTAGAEQITSSA
jgi:fumarate reductase flavoprotein subunit